MKKISRSPTDTKKIGAEFSKKLGKEGTLIGLIGDLGSGKTTFVQGMARGLGIDPDYYVNSPTFTLVNEYRGEAVCLIHVDLYRISRPGEAEMLALEEYIRPGNIVVVEWAERLPASLQKVDFQIRFEAVSDKERGIEISPPL